MLPNLPPRKPTALLALAIISSSGAGVLVRGQYDIPDVVLRWHIQCHNTDWQYAVAVGGEVIDVLPFARC
jgi:hypothetical protein